MPLSRADLILIEWVDSCGANGWQSLDGFDEWEPSKCVSVGWIMRETEQGVAVAPHVSNIDERDEKVDGVFMIPKVCITRREVLVSGADTVAGRSPT